MNTTEKYPNVYLKVHILQTDISLPQLEGIIEIWMKDSKCKVIDRTARYPYEILNDFKHERGLGQPPASMEEIMDIHTRRKKNKNAPPVTFSFDASTMKGKIKEANNPAIETGSNDLLILANEFLSTNLEDGLTATGETTFLNKKCKSYTYNINGEIDNAPYTTLRNILVYDALILRSESHDSAIPNYAFTWEVIEIKEGKVKDDDLN